MLLHIERPLQLLKAEPVGPFIVTLLLEAPTRHRVGGAKFSRGACPFEASRELIVEAKLRDPGSKMSLGERMGTPSQAGNQG